MSLEFPILYHGRMHIEVPASCNFPFQNPFFFFSVNNILNSRGATHLQGKYARHTTTIINENYKDQTSKLEMENCPEADIHSYKDPWNLKKLGILKDKHYLYLMNPL